MDNNDTFFLAAIIAIIGAIIVAFAICYLWLFINGVFLGANEWMGYLF